MVSKRKLIKHLKEFGFEYNHIGELSYGHICISFSRDRKINRVRLGGYPMLGDMSSRIDPYNYRLDELTYGDFFKYLSDNNEELKIKIRTLKLNELISS